MVEVLLGKVGVRVINVKHPLYGAYGDDSHDDTDAIQAAVDAAFGTAGSPHGTDSHLNIPLYFPAGIYKITAPINLTQVKGGHIFGAGSLSTWVRQYTADTFTFVSDGFENCLVERLMGVGFDLDWSGDGDVGLKGNSFFQANGSYRIGQSGNGGTDNRWTGCYFGGVYGLETRTAGAVGQVIQGGNFGGCTSAGVKVTAGGVSVINGTGFQQFAGGSWDVVVTDMEHPMTMLGCRTESPNFVELNDANGTVVLKGCMQTSGAGQFLNMGAAGKAIMDACASINGGTVDGAAGTVYARGCNFVAGALDGFLGTLHES